MEPQQQHTTGSSLRQGNSAQDGPTPSATDPPSRFHCSPEYHFAQKPFAGLLYQWAFRLSKGSGSFHASQENIAAYFGVSRWTVARAIDHLLKLGFFEPISNELFQSSVYHVLGHDDWAGKHPGLCVAKETLPWSSEEGDRLGRDLWNASGGKVKYQQFQLAALRRTGLPDDEIVDAFRQFIGNENRRRKEGGWRGRWHSVQRRFYRWLSGTMGQGELDRLGLAAFADSRKVSGIGV